MSSIVALSIPFVSALSAGASQAYLPPKRKALSVGAITALATAIALISLPYIASKFNKGGNYLVILQNKKYVEGVVVVSAIVAVMAMIASAAVNRFLPSHKLLDVLIVGAVPALSLVGIYISAM